ncbi:CCA tRNA nucleotidyltransferase [Blastomonas fulva]|uniref:CCA tRNA nucleotidyltransferase n=1 Tax=Blastomonas fulva TaxID=1550728 RepID=UPI0025A3583E|nr:CCA tRNA nucleotidyltransferase [Blastomonas fulva]MDM7929246.1 CCA tRNA nucleotidyltransferase [Blastomonas fulva]MDM7966016.1 CCA tRNA nucleotidyltransferase [Blastomonas fulva]
MTRISAAWTQRTDLAAMLAALDPGGDQCRYVGGAVRDALLGVDAVDVDIATRLLPEQVMAALADAGIKAVPTGMEHGTVTAVLPAGPVEITTLRRDVTTDGRHAEVAFTDDWREDAARRDFTINALFADPRTLEVTDYFGGEADLAARLVRFIGDADARILEDHLRILRLFRFHARFGGPADPDALAACARHADRLKALSRERIARELLLLLGSINPADAAQLMAQSAIWPVVLPEMAGDGLETLAMLLAREAQLGAKADPLVRLAALLPADPLVAEAVAARLRLSKAQRATLARYAARWPDSGTARQVAAAVQPADTVSNWLLLRGPDDALAHGWQSLKGWSVPEFPLGGRDILALGIHAGPDVARVLGETRRRWIAEDFPEPERVRQIAAQVAAA